MKMTIKKSEAVEVEAKTVRVSAKCSDLCFATLHDADGKRIGSEHDGYVPGWFPEHGGDYVDLVIDLETGRITNWTTPTAEQLAATFCGKPSDDE